MAFDRRTGPSAVKVLGLVLLAILANLAGALMISHALTPEIRDLISSWSGPLWLSVRVTVAAACFSGLAGIACGYLLAKGRFRGRDLLEALGSVSIILPPTVLGYYLRGHLNIDTSAGRLLEHLLGGPVVFQTRGIVLVAAIAGFPFALRASRAAIAGVDPRLEQAARALGLPEWRVALQVTLPAARRGLAVGLALAAARALGEYGATLMVGGDLAGQTRTMAVGLGDARTPEQQHALIVLMATIALVTMVGLVRLERGRVG